jgi:hypothetical protein
MTLLTFTRPLQQAATVLPDRNEIDIPDLEDASIRCKQLELWYGSIACPLEDQFFES